MTEPNGHDRADPTSSAAVLIGATRYRSGLPPTPQAEECVRQLAQRFTDENLWGIPTPSRIYQLINEDRSTILTTVRDAARLVSSPGILVVYYVGHAESFDGRLCLATAAGDRSSPSTTMIAVHDLVDAISRAGTRDAAKLLLLDCCSAGQAAKDIPMQAVRSGETAGWYVIGAAEAGATADAADGYLTTRFTGALLAALDGSPALGRALSGQDVFDLIKSLLPENPPVHSQSSAGQQVWLVNRRYQPTASKPMAFATQAHSLDPGIEPSASAPQRLMPASSNPHPAGFGMSADPKTELTSFDPEAVREFRSLLRSEVLKRFPPSLSAYEFLDRTAMRVDGRLTQTGVLLFGENSGAVNPSARVQCRRYEGTSLAETRDSLNLSGPLVQQIVEAREFVAQLVRRGEAPTADSARARDEYDLPMIAVREVIANALIHRDYTRTDGCVHIRLFADRLEVSSPGLWQGKPLPSESDCALGSLAGQSSKRNFRLAESLYWVMLVEGEGSGIPYAVTDCKRHDYPEPTVREEQGFVTVTLWRRRRVETPPPPEMLRPPPKGFVGREPELAHLDGLLDEVLRTADRGVPRVVLISGIPGVGKTATALHWAYRAKPAFPEGQLFLDLGGRSRSESPQDALRAALTALGIRRGELPLDVGSMASLYRSLTAKRRMLVLLVDAMEAEQVRLLLPTGPACLTVVTSRHPLGSLVALDNAIPVPLPPLSENDAVKMLHHRLSQASINADQELLRRIVYHCGGLPLALAIASASVSADRISVERLASQLADDQHRLSSLNLGDEATNIRRVFARSYDTLSATSQRVFRLLSAPFGSVDAYGVTNLAASTMEQTVRDLDELMRAGLIERDEHGHFRMHDLLRDYAHELANQESEHEYRDAVAKLLDYYLQTAQRADAILDPNWEEPNGRSPTAAADPTINSSQAAIDWFASELANLCAAISFAAVEGFERHAFELMWAMTTFLYRNLEWHAWIRTGQAALTAAQKVGDDRAAARTHRIVASAYARLEQYEDASRHHQKALDIFIAIGDEIGQAHTFLMLGRLLGWQGEHKKALDLAQTALRKYRALGEPTWEARALHDVARQCGKTRDTKSGIASCIQALEIASRLGDKDAEATAHATFGQLYRDENSTTEAIAHLEKAAAIRNELGDLFEEATSLKQLAGVYREAGRIAEAQQTLARARTNLEQVGSPVAQLAITRLEVAG